MRFSPMGRRPFAEVLHILDCDFRRRLNVIQAGWPHRNNSILRVRISAPLRSTAK